jgi:hypothetical protein
LVQKIAEETKYTVSELLQMFVYIKINSYAWKPTTAEKICISFGLLMLIGIQKPSVQSYFSTKE